MVVNQEMAEIYPPDHARSGRIGKECRPAADPVGNFGGTGIRVSDSTFPVGKRTLALNAALKTKHLLPK